MDMNRSLDDLPEGWVKPHSQQRRLGKRVKSLPNFWGSLVLALIGAVIGVIGIALLVVGPWVLGVICGLAGLLFFVIGCVLDVTHYGCSLCGNRVERKSTLCPHCGAHLSR